MYITKFRIFIVLLALAVSCGQREEPAEAVLDKIFSHYYCPQQHGLKSLSLIVSGSNDVMRQFARSFDIHDSIEVHIFWKAPHSLKSIVYTRGKNRRRVLIPRWVDYGLAFGLTHGSDGLPLFFSKQIEISKISDSLKMQAGISVPIESEKENRYKITFASEDKKTQHIFITDKYFRPLLDEIREQASESDTTIFVRLKRQWLVYSNGKVTIRQQERRTGQWAQNRFISRIMYQKFGEYWLPEWIYYIANTVGRGRISYGDQKMKFLGYQINPILRDSLFAFPILPDASIRLDSPMAALNSLISALNAGEKNQVRRCFSAGSIHSFNKLIKNSAGDMQRFGMLPDSLFQLIRADANHWYFKKTFGTINNYILQKKETQSESLVIMKLKLEGGTKITTGEYRFIKEEAGWKIDNAPFLNTN